MTYTLDMAAEQEPHIADDGIQEVPLTKARALLTRLIEQVREDGLISALTIRGRRRAYLVAPGFYDRARLHGEVVGRLREVVNRPGGREALEEVDDDLALLLDTGQL